MRQTISHLGEEKYNKQGCLMKIIEYNDTNNITVEFQDEHNYKTHTTYGNYKKGSIKNLYYPTVYGVGIIGDKYQKSIKDITIKEYNTWLHILQRCYSDKFKKKQPAYDKVECCEEWLYYPNFYEWLHSQSNFDKWYNGNRWAIDKDILHKGNKIYSPDNCCLVPQSINCLFISSKWKRSSLPVGVGANGNKFEARCKNSFTGELEHLGIYDSSEEAFYKGYKPYKENLIKQTAQTEYNQGNITKACYDAMIRYEVEIDD